MYLLYFISKAVLFLHSSPLQHTLYVSFQLHCNQS
nr:MAG TPA: hypothetical protein [Caudoviricetes sp.]